MLSRDIYPVSNPPIAIRIVSVLERDDKEPRCEWRSNDATNFMAKHKDVIVGLSKGTL